MKFYHATDYNNLESILKNGINCSCDGCVYMTKKEIEALRFTVFRPYEKTVVLEINIPREFKVLVQETFDHNEYFFKSRAYGYFAKNLPKEWVRVKNIYERKQS